MTQKASEVPQNSGVPTPEFRDLSQSSDTGPRTLGPLEMPVLLICASTICTILNEKLNQFPLIITHSYFDFYAVYFCIWTFYKHTGVKKCKPKLHLVTQRRSFWEIYKISLEQIWGILWSFSLFMCLCYSACCGGPVWTQDAWTLGSISLN